MGQQRKDSPPNSQAPATISNVDVDTQTTGTATGPSLPASNKRTSWYGGSWRSKAQPVAEVAKESVSVAKGATSESSSDSQSLPGMPNNPRMSRKSIPSAAEATRVNASGSNIDGNKSKEKVTEKQPPKAEEVSISAPPSVQPTDGAKDIPIEPPTPPDPIKDNVSETSSSSKHNRNSSSWTGWWSRPDDYPPSEAGRSNAAKADEAKGTPRPGSPTESGPEFFTANKLRPTNTEGNTNDQLQPNMQQSNQRQSSARSWFGLWSASQNETADEAEPLPTQEPDLSSVAGQAPDTGRETVEPKSTLDARERADSDENRPRSSGWAFWSKDKPTDESARTVGTQKHLGELAVADTPSQSHPTAAQFNESNERDPQGKIAHRQPLNKDGKPLPKTIKTGSALATNAETPSASLPGTPDKSGKAEAAAKVGNTATKPLKTPQTRPNLILPTFRDTYSPAYIPSYWERFGQYIASSLRIIDATPTTANHVAISPEKPKVKNAVAIGVHGYFPAALIQKVLGQPTGTSIRFANYAASAIKAWTEQNQPDTPCEIEQVALEGEGFIADRVSTLWKLLLNWLSHLRSADLILVAAHSQGVPVAIMLVAKLINLGCLSPHAKIGICAMAGINLGPFADYKSKIYGGSAVELFEFNRPDSKVSKDYAAQLEVVLRHGVRITYIGSIDDQLVSLESSLFSNLTHPYVQRAVFVDGRVHTADFMNQLVAFALKLRNLGISDHGLIRELSYPLAGSIYGGEGHSRVYDDDAVYRLALEFTLETTDIDPKTTVHASGSVETPSDDHESGERRRSQGGIPASTVVANSIRRGSFSAAGNPGIAPYIAPYEVPVSGANANPFFLPWAMRGILEEEAVKKDMQDEVKELIRLFDEWKPTTKPLKDVKFRLEAVKSKL
ncbi:hypothetical protein MBLNU457_3943t1 [Dothideomycetes sp. NU457]